MATAGLEVSQLLELALLLLDGPQKSRLRLNDRPEIGALLAIQIGEQYALGFGIVDVRDVADLHVRAGDFVVERFRTAGFARLVDGR